MDQQKRKRLVYIIIAIIVIAAIIFLFIKFAGRNGQPNLETYENQPIYEAPSIDLTYQAPEAPEQSPTEFAISNLAMTYAARFGTKSSDNQTHNYQELLPLSTNTMKNWLQTLEADYENQEFKGMTTKSLSFEILDQSSSAATVLVHTQQIETGADLKTAITYKDLKVELINSGGTWLVDGVYWQ